MIFDVLAVVVFLNVMATITLWRQAARRPPKLKKKFITALLDSKPIVPEHQPPKIITEDFQSFGGEGDRLFFDDFAEFAAAVNRWLGDKHVGGPWRLQELPDTELRLDFWDEPHFGRRYAVFHNQVRIGTLELSPVLYDLENRSVRAMIRLSWVRLLAFGEIAEFLDAIAMHISSADCNSKEYLQARLGITSALARAMWETLQISEFGMDGQGWGELEIQINGSASWYFVRKDGLGGMRAAK